MKYTYIIIDSDASTSLQLQLQMQEYGDFVCTATAKNELEGMNSILKYLPDIIIINLTEDAPSYFRMIFELHRYLKNIPILIGVANSTAHAYEAIKSGFYDYWLLPHNEFEIRKTALKLKKELQDNHRPTTICLKSYRDFQYLDTNEILYLKADNNSTDFVMSDDSVVSAFKTLKSFEKALPKNFIRIHQSYIINSTYVARINYGKAICTLKNNIYELPFSKTYRTKVDRLKEILSKNAIRAYN